MLETKRLFLNNFVPEDALMVATLAGDLRVVEMTATIPYPYEPHMALEWISGHEQQRLEETNYVFAIRLKEDGALVGCINISLNKRHGRGLLGYWIGHDFWGKGICTEALREVLRFGFEDKKLNKIWAEHKRHNLASAKVMEKAGMRHEGLLRNHYQGANGMFFDMSIKSILKEEFFQKE